MDKTDFTIRPRVVINIKFKQIGHAASSAKLFKDPKSKKFLEKKFEM